MPTPVHSEHRHHSRFKRNFGALYSAITLLALHWAFVIYVNSSYVGQFIPESAIGLLFTTSSAITILIFLFISRVLHRVGNYKLTLFLATLEVLMLIGMAFADSLRTAIPLFMVHQAILPLLLYNLDVFMEEMIGNKETETGSRRGLYLGVMSLAGAIAPLGAGFLVSEDGDPSFTPVYLTGAIIMLPFLYIIVRYFRTFSDPKYSEIKVLDAIHRFWVKKDIRNVFLAHFHLQLFFTSMIIYAPLYLATQAGFSWSEIGLILFVGLMAYVFLEYPIGIIADRYTGEKEMMALGFITIGVSVSWLAFLPAGAIGLWMFAMFMTRVGASFVEATTESYFFKHTKGSDANIISFFRITRPLSYVVGALLGSLTLLYLPLNLLFVVIGVLMAPALIFSLMLKDTK